MAPVAAIRASASSVVVQAIDVPRLFTSGKAAQVRVAAQPVETKLPLTHCAKPPSMHALSPALQDELALSPANLRFSACASWPLASAKGFALGSAAGAGAGAGAGAAGLLSVFAAGAATGVAGAAVPLPLMPPVAPVAAMRASASASVVHVSDVPSLLTSGRARHWVPLPQDTMANLPLTHCAKPPAMQAWSPSAAMNGQRQSETI